MKFLKAKDLNLLRGIFLMGKISKFFAVGRIFPHPQGYTQRFRGKGNSPHLVGTTIFDILVRREMSGI